MAEHLKRESEKFGLSINFSKTKIMTNVGENDEIRLEQNPIKTVSEYKYLGQTMFFGNRTKKQNQN